MINNYSQLRSLEEAQDCITNLTAIPAQDDDDDDDFQTSTSDNSE